MSALFPKTWKITVDTLDVSALDLEFKILRNLKSEPNKCVLTVWNLNKDHRAQIQLRNRPINAAALSALAAGGSIGASGGTPVKGIAVRIEAGYVNNSSVLFDGDLREVTSALNGIDDRTTLSGDDGGRAHREGRINVKFAAGTAVGDALKTCASALGLGAGNVSNYTTSAQIAGIGTTLPHGITLSGNVAREMDRLCDSIGVTWSIQSGTIQILAKGTALKKQAILLSPTTGLLDSPEPSIDSTISLGSPQQFAAGAKQKTAKPPKPKSTSILKFKAMLIPGLTPGQIVKIQSAEVNGTYEVMETEAVGQTWSTQWEMNCVGRVYQSSGSP